MTFLFFWYIWGDKDVSRGTSLNDRKNTHNDSGLFDNQREV